MADYWIKLYHEILDDPKMATLPDNVWRKVIELFLVAGRMNKDGEIPDAKQIAWMMRCDQEIIEKALIEIEKIGIAVKTDNGWIIQQFKKRQGKISGADRTKASREKSHRGEYYCNDSVTSLKRYVTQIRTDTDTDIDIEQIRSDTPPLFSLYEKEIGMITPMIADTLQDWEKTYPNEWFPEAFKEAVDHNARNLKYIKVILENWKNKGRFNGKPTAQPKKHYEFLEDGTQVLVDIPEVANV